MAESTSQRTSSSNNKDSNSQPQNKRRQPRKASNNPVAKLPEDMFQYQCEWRACKEVQHDMIEFIYHVSFHISDYMQESFAPELVTSGGMCFSCGWHECGAQILGSVVDFNRHVYFHVFHVRIKCLGMHLSQELGLGQCMLGTQSRNWIPELPENLECSWSECGVVFDNPYIFYLHVCSHTEIYPDGKTVQCKCLWSGCDALVRSKHKLKEHLRSHTQEKIIACPTCGGLFCSRTKLTDHIRRQAQSELLRYECSHCNRRFSTERMLREHMRRHVNHYKCPLCEMTCPTPSALRQHARYRHSEEKPFKCGHCEFSAKSSGDLRKHLDSHNVDDQFSCHIDGCNFTARAYGSLALHFKKQHQGEHEEPPRYKCHVCDKTFVRGYPLTFHLKKKHMFQWPPGHSRFRYKLHSDGYFRLQTVRYESIDVTEPAAEDENNENSASSTSTSTSTSTSNSSSDKNSKRTDAAPRTRPSQAGAKSVAEHIDSYDAPLNLSRASSAQQRSKISPIQEEPLNLTLPSSKTHDEGSSTKSGRKRARKESVPRKKTRRTAEATVYVDIADQNYTAPQDGDNEMAMEDVSYEGDVKGYSSQSFVAAGCEERNAVSCVQPGYVSGTDLRQRYQGIAVEEYGEAADANLHMLGDVALKSATKDLTAITPLEAL